MLPTRLFLEATQLTRWSGKTVHIDKMVKAKYRLFVQMSVNLKNLRTPTIKPVGRTETIFFSGEKVG